MPATFDRIRSRTFPIKRSGVQTLGKKFPWNTNTKNWHGSPNATYTYNFNLPWIAGETCGDFLHKGPPYLEGSPFKLLNIERVVPYGIQGVGQYYRDAGLQQGEKYVGGFSPPDIVVFGGPDVSNVNTALSLNSIQFPELQQHSGSAWSKTKPKLEKANLFVSMVEARDIPRMLRTTARFLHDEWKAIGGNLTGETMTPKGAADQFLNGNFGWVPFLSDLRTLFAVYHGTDHYMKRVSETNSKPTRRRSTLVGLPVGEVGPDGKPRIRYDPVRSDLKVSGGFGQICNPVLNANFFSVNPSWETREIVEDKVTAVGKFTFYRPEFDTGLSEYNSQWFAIQRQLTMYGLRINPSNIYRATPWTWLIDWFVNVGDHFDLLTDMLVDSIVANYLFLTQRKVTTRRVIQTLPFRETGSLTLYWDFIIKTIERVGANSPYGFSLTWDTLTPRQLAILGALGITRSRPAGG
jgi:hypothetical protein